jgi:hypothetical protein
MIQTFLPALHELQYATAEEVFFSISQPCTCSLLDCLVVFIVLAPHVIFQGPEQVLVQKGKVWRVGRKGEHLPAKLSSFL